MVKPTVKPTAPGLTLTLVVAALVGYTFVLAPKLGLASRAESADASPAASAPASGAATVFPPRDKTFIGVTTSDGTGTSASVDAFATATRHRPAVMMFSQDWAVQDFDRTAFDTLAQQGMLPMLSWEPWARSDGAGAGNAAKEGNPAEPQYRPSRIAAGAFDDYLRAYARGVKDLDYHVAIRFAHDMNSSRYPWGANVNGNQSGDYVKMWRHVHDIFTSEGATNVIWVWSAAGTESRARLATFYPGDDYVDWVGLSGYYGTPGTQGYRSPDSIFDAALADLQTFAKRPIVITETGAADTGGFKARWVRDLFQYLPRHTDIIGFIWCEAVRGTDWRISSSPAAAQAFAELAADPRYAVSWAPGLLPRTSVTGTTPGPAAVPTSQSASPTPTRTASPKPTPGRTRPPSRPPAATPTADPSPTHTTPAPAPTPTQTPAAQLIP